MSCSFLAAGLRPSVITLVIVSLASNVGAQTCGDCDLNGAGPNILDALTAAQIAAMLITPVPPQPVVCDVDSSMTVNVLDALAMAQIAAGIGGTANCPMTGGSKLYVNIGSAVELVDLATDMSVGTVPLAGLGQGIAIDDAGDFVYATDGNTLVEIDTVTDMVTNTFTLTDSRARQVTIVGTDAYVAHFVPVGNGRLDRVNLLTSVVNSLTIDVGAWGMGRNSSGSAVYAAHIGNGDVVTRISTSTFTVSTSMSLPENPISVEENPVTGEIYVGCRDADPDMSGLSDLHILNSATLASIDLLDVDDAWGMAVLPTGDFLYVGSNHQVGVPAPPYFAQKVDLLTATVLPAMIPIGDHPWYFAIDDAGQSVFTCDNASNQITRIDTATDTVSATISLSGSPRDAVVK